MYIQCLLKSNKHFVEKYTLIKTVTYYYLTRAEYQKCDMLVFPVIVSCNRSPVVQTLLLSAQTQRKQFHKQLFLIDFKIVAMLQVHRMVQCHIQMVQLISLL